MIYNGFFFLKKKNPSVECAVTEIMTFLTKVCTLTEFYHIFAEIKKM